MLFFQLYICLHVRKDKNLKQRFYVHSFIQHALSKLLYVPRSRQEAGMRGGPCPAELTASWQGECTNTTQLTIWKQGTIAGTPGGHLPLIGVCVRKGFLKEVTLVKSY